MALKVFLAFGALTVLSALAALAGLPFLSWYADDACPREEWQCSAGDIGFSAVFLGLLGAAVTGVLTLITGAVYLWLRNRPRKGGSG